MLFNSRKIWDYLPDVGKNINITHQDLICRLAGMCSGLLLAVTNIYPIFVPFQIIAFIPVFYLGISTRIRSRGMIVAGLYMGLGYILPQLFVLRLPTMMSALLLIWFIIIMIIISWASGKLLIFPGVSGALAMGALLVLVDWINFTAVPIWGTAQSIVRSWSQYPNLIQFVSQTGILGIIFVIGTLQAIAVKLIFEPSMRGRLFVAMASIILVILTTNLFMYFSKPAGRLKVAAVGWTSDYSAKCGETYSLRGFNTLIATPAKAAAETGARLIVYPELAIGLTKENKEEWLSQLAQITRSYNIFLAIGYWDISSNENKMIFVSPLGEIIGEYTKTYLTAFEDFKKGNGCLTKISVDGFSAGAMICQDDNFTHLSREYGRKRISLVAVPTLDWKQVKDAHLQNSIYRAIESRYAIVRAACNGISAIIAPDGKVLAIKDHFRDGPGFVIAETPLYSGGSLFSYLGHWPVVPSVIFLVVYIGFRFKKACI
jgi:apolipoprotein N-acyltransferase